MLTAPYDGSDESGWRGQHPETARHHRPAGARRGIGAGHCRARPPAGLDRAVLLPPLKAALGRGRDEIRRRFEAGGTAARASPSNAS